MGGRVLFAMVISALPALASIVPASSNAYETIEERNAFGLKPAEPPPQAQPAQSKPLPKVYLTGITTILGTKQALLMITPAESKSGDKPESFILAEGQGEGAVQVTKIDEKAGTVRLVNSGTAMTITFEDPPPSGLQGASTNLAAGHSGATNMTAPGQQNPNPVRDVRQFAGRFARGSLPSSATNVPSPPSAPGSPPPNEQLTSEESRVLKQIEEQAQEQTRHQKQQEQNALPEAGTDQQYIYRQATPRHIQRPPYPILPQ